LFADIVFPEERMPCIIGRELRFLLAVEERGAVGCCVLAFSTEPLRTEMLFIHSIRNEAVALESLVDDVLSFLKTRRAPDLEVKYIKGMHSGSLREILQERGFAETIKDRMLLEVSNWRVPSKLEDRTLRVTTTGSLLNWRAINLSATTNRPFEECKKQVHSETPNGTIQEDDLSRLIAYDERLPVGTIGYSLCRNIGYLERLSVLPHLKDKTAVARALLSEAVKIVLNKKCDHVVMDIGDDFRRDMIEELGFRSARKVSYFNKVITKSPARELTHAEEN
jgi:hypothetical protein